MDREVKPLTIVLVVLALAAVLFGVYRHFGQTEQHPVSQQDIQRMLGSGGAGASAQQGK